jgi:membrane protein implicated in regulation of membrane protease activity
MKRETIVFFFGIVIVLLPFLGIPSMWKRVVFVMIGLALMLFGYQLRRRAYLRSIESRTGERRTAEYVEQMQVVADLAPVRLPSEAEVSDESETPPARARRARTKVV